MKTILHYYQYNISSTEEREAYLAFRKQMEALPNTPFHDVIEMGEGPRKDLIATIRAMSGRDIEIDTTFLFSNQWNTVGKPGLRLMEFREWKWPNADIKEGYWIDITPEMRAAREKRLRCGYCGYQTITPTNDGFCPQCLGSRYLEVHTLHLTRLLPVLDLDSYPLSPEEREHLMPRYREAQAQGETERGVAVITSLRNSIISKHNKSVEGATQERDGYLWLLDHGLGVRMVDNCIYYPSTGTFVFGWRSPIHEDDRKWVRDNMDGFPFKWEFKR